MDESRFLAGFDELDQLSRGDYRKPLNKVLSELPASKAAERIERLIGVMLKAPFASPEDLGTASAYSESYRGWNLDETRFASSQAVSTWQYQLLEQMRREPENVERFATVLDLARDAHFERGFFGYFARSLQKYICDDPRIRKAIDKSVKEGKASWVRRDAVDATAARPGRRTSHWFLSY